MKPVRMAYPQINLVAPVQLQALELVIGHFCKNAVPLNHWSHF